MYNIGLVSLGCAKNQTDAEIMLGILANDGFNITYNPSDADVIIVNTCGFIESAKQESIDAILEMAQYKNGRCRLLIATGCLAERYSGDILIELPEVDAIVGTGDYDKIAEVIREAFKGEKPVICGHNDRTPDERLPRILSTPSYTAYLKIADGCDNNCTYCAIPMIRGHFRSRKIEDIVEEAENLAKNGVKELILIAQDTSRYGKDLYGEYSLDKLLEKLPVQHGNNEILRRMARRTTQEQMVERINKIREKMPDCTIRTSIIVGFPGETEEQFNDLYEFVKKVRFDRMGAFTYSQEEDTPAADFPNQVDEEIKEERLDRLMTLQQGISLELNKAKLGKTLEVLVEGYDEESFLFYGRSRGDSIDVDGKVYFATEEEVTPGDIIKVKILDADEYDLTGQAEVI